MKEIQDRTANVIIAIALIVTPFIIVAVSAI